MEEEIHLFFLVHGLWGNGSHFSYFARILKEISTNSILHENGNTKLNEKSNKSNAKIIKKTKTRLVPYICTSFEGTYTYDGVDICGEKVASEMLDVVNTYNCNSNENTNMSKITKVSVVGYSMGGLIARYALGILATRFSTSFFNENIDKNLNNDNLNTLYPFGAKIKLVMFATFASPHVGARAVTNFSKENNKIPFCNSFSDQATRLPLGAKLYNWFVPFTLSDTGKQLFLIDNDGGSINNSDCNDKKRRPLIVAMSDPNSVFFKTLANFEIRVAYSNIINDRRTSWYTSCFDTQDIFADYNLIPKFVYIEDYNSIVLDPLRFAMHKYVTNNNTNNNTNNTSNNNTNNSNSKLTYLFNTGKFIYKFLISWQVILTVPFWIITYLISTNFNSLLSRRRLRGIRNQKYLSQADFNEWCQEQIEDVIEDVMDKTQMGNTLLNEEYFKNNNNKNKNKNKNENKILIPSSSGILDLAPEQKYIINNLNKLSWNKFGVFIKNTKATHAAIIVRNEDKKSLDEGRLVVSHWINNFVIPVLRR